MSLDGLELSVLGPVGWLLVGGVLGALIPQPFTSSRLRRLLEGASVACIFGTAFVLGAGDLDHGRQAFSMVAVCLGLLLYFGFLNVIGIRVRRLGSSDEAGTR